MQGGLADPFEHDQLDLRTGAFFIPHCILTEQADRVVGGGWQPVLPQAGADSVGGPCRGQAGTFAGVGDQHHPDCNPLPVGDRELCLFFDRMAEGVAEIQLLAKPCVPFVLLNDQPFQVDAPGDYLGELFAQPALLEQPEKGG